MIPFKLFYKLSCSYWESEKFHRALVSIQHHNGMWNISFFQYYDIGIVNPFNNPIFTDLEGRGVTILELISKDLEHKKR